MATPDAPVPMRFGNYEVLPRPGDGKPDELGRGGFGCTYRARHRFLDKVVALKVITDRLARDPETQRRFLKEAREHSALEHPGIARLTDFGEAEGTFFYALDYCGGGDLRRLVERGGALPARAAVVLIRQIAEALRYAHARGVIHRDIKPANVMHTTDETGAMAVKIIDFGLVKRLVKTGADETVNQLTASVWSAAFASPEQVDEQPLDERTDIFSLGMTAWYLLAGGGPVHGSPMKIVQERMGADSYEPLLPANLTDPLRGVIARMVEKDRERRYRTCAELLAALDAATPERSRPVLSIPPSAEQGTMFSQPEDSSPSQTPDEAAAALTARFDLSGPLPAVSGGVVPAFDRERQVRVRLTRLSAEDHGGAFVAGVRRKVERLMRSPLPGIAAVLALKRIGPDWLVAQHLPDGLVLGDTLRRHGPVTLEKIAPLLAELAAALDAATAAGLTLMPLEQAILENVSENGGVDWSTVSLRSAIRWADPLPVADRPAASADTAEPIAPAPLQDFAALIYLAVSKRRVPPRAFHSSSAFAAVSTLSAAGNHSLAVWLSGEQPPVSARALVRELLATGLPESVPPLQFRSSPPVIPPMTPAPGPATVRLTPAGPAPAGNPSRRRFPLKMVAAILLLALGGGAAWYIFIEKRTPASLPAEKGDLSQASSPNRSLGPLPALPPDSAASGVLAPGDAGKTSAVLLPGGLPLVLCYCPAGTFTIGSPESEPGRAPGEKEKAVILTNGFWLAETELTRAQRAAALSLPAVPEHEGALPADNISWQDAQDLLTALTKTAPLPAGWRWSLPTEAQWEYACRAGNVTAFNNGSPISNPDGEDATLYYLAWYVHNSDKTSHPPKARAPNVWGLYDMHGNMAEWCRDAVPDAATPSAGGADPLGAGGSLRVLRGGSFTSLPRQCRSASRSAVDPGLRDVFTGLRPAAVPLHP